MTDKTSPEEEVVEEAVTLPVKVESIDLEGPGIAGVYRKILRLQEAFSGSSKVTVEEYDKALSFIIDHIVEPSDQDEKEDLVLNQLNAEQLKELITRIAGGDEAVPPLNGGDSATT